MPIFEYKCSVCGKIFDVLMIPGKANGEINCPECGGVNLEKLMSTPFLPGSVGKPANEERTGSCCGGQPGGGCTPGSCCGGTGVH